MFAASEDVTEFFKEMNFSKWWISSSIKINVSTVNCSDLTFPYLIFVGVCVISEIQLFSESPTSLSPVIITPQCNEHADRILTPTP